MTCKPQVGDSAGWQEYWNERGKINRDKCDRMAEIIRAMKTCGKEDFEGLAQTLRAIDTDDVSDVVQAIRAGRDAGKYTNPQTNKGERKWNQ